MPSGRSSGAVALFRMACFASLAAVACEQPPDADSLKEWGPGDHHSADDDKLNAGAQASPSRGPKGTDDTPQLVELTWRQQCVQCHGGMGKGDGQMGPMLQAPDLTRQEWQAKVTDADMAAVIKNGKNKMPKFDVPDPVIVGLVARIRSLRGR